MLYADSRQKQVGRESKHNLGGLATRRQTQRTHQPANAKAVAATPTQRPLPRARRDEWGDRAPGFHEEQEATKQRQDSSEARRWKVNGNCPHCKRQDTFVPKKSPFSSSTEEGSIK